MLKKKNYKEIDHFSHFRSVTIPRANGEKVIIYFKRYLPPNESKAS